MSLNWTMSTMRCRKLLRVAVYANTSTTAFHMFTYERDRRERDERETETETQTDGRVRRSEKGPTLKAMNGAVAEVTQRLFQYYAPSAVCYFRTNICNS